VAGEPQNQSGYNAHESYCTLSVNPQNHSLIDLCNRTTVFFVRCELCLSVFLSICLSISLSIYLIYLSIYISIYQLPMCSFNNLISLCVSNYLSLSLSKHTFIYLLSGGLMNFLFTSGTTIWVIDCHLKRPPHSNIKFHENPAIGSRIISCRRKDRRTDMTKLTVAFRNFAIAHKTSFCKPFHFPSSPPTSNCSTHHHITTVSNFL
jgi:hypothetical protein